MSPAPTAMRPLGLLLASVLLVGCRSSHAPTPTFVSDGPVQTLTLRVPDGYAVRSAGFEFAYATDVSGGPDVNGTVVPLSTSQTERPFVHVYAVEVATGMPALLIYRTLGQRQDPVVIIRLEGGAGAENPR